MAPQFTTAGLLSPPKVSLGEFNGLRMYCGPDGIPRQSVTSFLSEAMTAKGLDAWRSRVGPAAANAKMKRGAGRGTIVHALLKEHLIGEPVPSELAPMPIHKDMAWQIKPILEANLQFVHLIETPLVSAALDLAGTPDVIGIWNGHITVIDFKTASTTKLREYAVKHFLQAAAYGLMFEETFGQQYAAKSIVIIIANEDGPPATLFVEPFDPWARAFRDLWDYKHPAALLQCKLGPRNDFETEVSV